MQLTIHHHLRTPGVDRWLDRFDRVLLRVGRDSAPLPATQPLRSMAGYPLQAQLWWPEGPGPFPMVVVIPDHGDTGLRLCGSDSVLQPQELTRRGIACATLDLAGRGSSWGEDDFGGPEHQDNIVQLIGALRADPRVRRAGIGLLGLGGGIQAALGAAHQVAGAVAWVVDWEGPADQETTHSLYGDTHAACGVDDAQWWSERAAVALLARLPCGYVRLQAEEDHRKPGELRHALRCMHAAADGGLPWFQINDHPRGERPLRPQWLGRGLCTARGALLAKLAALTAP